MIEIFISIILLWIIALLTWNYLTTNVIILISCVTLVLCAYRLIRSFLDDKHIPATSKKKYSYKDLNIIDRNTNIYFNDSFDYQYAAERILLKEYKENSQLKLFEGLTNEKIIKNNYTQNNPLYKYKQGYISLNIILELKNINSNSNMVEAHYDFNDRDIIVFQLEDDQAKQIIDNFSNVMAYGLRIYGGNKKYVALSKNGVMVIKKVNEPYKVELLVQYQD